MVVGGSAAPEQLIRDFDRLGMHLIHAWGMTETSPIGTVGGVPAALGEVSADERTRIKLRQGRPPFGVELRLADDAGADLPWDGATPGRLLVRGFAVAAAYVNGAGGEILDSHGFFDTGDVATIDPHGVMQITDRAKDVIKSGGEWISSIEIENLALSHPAVANAAAIGVPHPKWDERPVLVVEARPGLSVTAAELAAWLEGRIGFWALSAPVALYLAAWLFGLTPPSTDQDAYINGLFTAADFPKPTSAAGWAVGNLPRNAYRGPNYRTTDLSFFKTFVLPSNIGRIQFRAEAFNVFNHVSLGNPDPCVDCGNNGRIFSLAPNAIMRRWQFGMRFDF